MKTLITALFLIVSLKACAQDSISVVLSKRIENLEQKMLSEKEIKSAFFCEYNSGTHVFIGGLIQIATGSILTAFENTRDYGRFMVISGSACIAIGGGVMINSHRILKE